ncbi:Uncharacterised protein [Mobiluncus curtisii]|uniref:DUF4921 domain-containing protein n=1 Tax=Mobiluncus curtisii TaxID=2051 RepID=A0A2X3BZL7_9ACTO|nr:Uncharacterised protein [Mobiluncus curtisii]
MMILGNDYAVGFADFGHRYQTIAVWPLGPALLPWEYTREQVDGISDVLHALHCAVGPAVPTNEEWYHRPVDLDVPLRFRILLKQRTSTLAGFEGSTRIYLNSVDPWTLGDEMVTLLGEKARTRSDSTLAAAGQRIPFAERFLGRIARPARATAPTKPATVLSTEPSLDPITWRGRCCLV